MLLLFSTKKIKTRTFKIVDIFSHVIFLNMCSLRILRSMWDHDFIRGKVKNTQDKKIIKKSRKTHKERVEKHTSILIDIQLKNTQKRLNNTQN